MQICVYHGILTKCDPYYQKHHADKFPCASCKANIDKELHQIKQEE